MHNSMYIRHINSPSNDEPSKAVNHRFFPPIISSSVRVAMHLGQCVVRGTIQSSTTLGGHVACGSNGILPGLRVQVAYRSPRVSCWKLKKDKRPLYIVDRPGDDRLARAIRDRHNGKNGCATNGYAIKCAALWQTVSRSAYIEVDDVSGAQMIPLKPTVLEGTIRFVLRPGVTSGV